MGVSITGFRVAHPLPRPGEEGTVAVLTILTEDLVVGGYRLAINPAGELFLKSPKMRYYEDRVVIRSRAAREQVLQQAETMLRGLLSARIAESPVATASSTSEPTA